MFSLFRRKENLPDVPAWASFFDKSEYKSFIDTIEKYFYKKNVTYTMDTGTLTPQSNDFGFSMLGLSNLSQNCKQGSRADYYKIVSAHFDSMLRSHQYNKELDKIIEDFEQVKKYLGVRIYAEEYIAHVGKENTVSKHIAGELYATMVLDLPEAVQTVSAEKAEKWGKTRDELLEIGVQNIKSNYTFNVSKEALEDFKIWLITGEHFFTPNILFDLQNRPNLVGKSGALIGLPHRHAVIIYPIDDLDFVKTINVLIPLISSMYEEGPGSVSTNLLWYYNGEFENQPYVIEEGTIQFTPTEGFLEMINDWAGDE
jgi:hypothetical protein